MTTCSTGSPRLALDALDEVAPQPARALAGEGRDDDLVDPLVAHAWIAAVYGIRMRDLAVRVDPLPRSSASARRSRRSASGCSSWREVALRRDRAGSSPAPCSRAPRIRSSSGSPTIVSFATTSTFFCPPSSARSTTTCSTGSSRGDLLDRARRRCAAASPTAPADGSRRRSPSAGGSSCASASRTASAGSDSTTKPCAEMPASRRRASVRSSRRPRRGAARVLVDDVALARAALTGQIDRDQVGRRRGPRVRALDQARARRPSRSRSRGRGSVASAHLFLGSCTRSPLKIAWRAPGTPYSYGLADDLRDLVEVEDRRRRGDLPLERQRAPRVARRQRPARPAEIML